MTVILLIEKNYLKEKKLHWKINQEYVALAEK